MCVAATNGQTQTVGGFVQGSIVNLPVADSLDLIAMG